MDQTVRIHLTIIVRQNKDHMQCKMLAFLQSLVLSNRIGLKILLY